MTFNTGNPVGSADARDLYDNAQNIDIAVNSPQTTFTDRLGKARLTFAGMASAAGDATVAISAAASALSSAGTAQAAADDIEERAQVIATEAAVAAVAASTEAAIQQAARAESEANRAQSAADAAALSGGTYASTSAGLAATTAGEYFSVPQAAPGDYLILYRHDAGPVATEINRYPSSAGIAGLTSAALNAGKIYPLRQLTRNSITSASSNFLLNAILDVRVEGAKADHYYAIRVFKNGSTSLGGPADGWTIEEVPIAGYATSAYAAANAVILYTDPCPTIDRSLGIQTISLKSPYRDVVVNITLDPSKFPTYGTLVRATSTGDAGYSWVIDPACYRGAGVSAEFDCVHYTSDAATKQMTISWLDSGRCYGFTFGPNGANSLPNFSGVYVGAQGAARPSAVSLFSTDWLPPLIFNVNAEPRGTDYFTGGNHSVNGFTTAVNRIYSVTADGAAVEFGSNGSCRELTILIVNDIAAANTVNVRNAMRQAFCLTFRAGGVEVSCECTALEPLKVLSDYGPQLVGTGFLDTQLYIKGQYAGRVPFNSENTSGAYSAYPDAWATILKGPSGQLASWLDLDYGVPSTLPLDASDVRIKGGGGSSTKQYHAAIRSFSAPYAMSTGDKYKWRGGYSLGVGNVSAPFDSLLVYWAGGVRKSVLPVTAVDYITV